MRIKADSITYMYMHDIQLFFRSLTSYILMLSLISCIRNDTCKEMIRYRVGSNENSRED